MAVFGAISRQVELGWMMRRANWRRCAIFLLLGGASGFAQQTEHPWAIEVHGGAGVIERMTMDAKTEAAYRASMAQAIGAGARSWMRAGRHWMQLKR